MRRLIPLLFLWAFIWACRGTRHDDALCHMQSARWQGRGNLQSPSGDTELGWTATTTDVNVAAEVVRIGNDAFLRGTFSGDGVSLNARMDLSKAAGVFLSHDLPIPAPGKLLPGTGVMIKPGADGGIRAMPSTFERDAITFFGKRIEFPLTCADLSLTAGSASLDERLSAAGFTPIGFADLRDGAISLSDSRDGPAVAELGAEHPTRVALLDRSEDRTRIAFPGDHGALWVGWVASSSTSVVFAPGVKLAVRPNQTTSQSSSELALLRDREDVAHVCSSAMKLNARIGDTLTEIGTLAAGTHFWPHAEWHKLVHVTVGGWFHPDRDVRLMVDASAAQCPEVAALKPAKAQAPDAGTAIHR